MANLLTVVAILLVLASFPALAIVIHGPTRADRVLASQMIGTIGIAVLLIVGFAQEEMFALDVALILALLVLCASVTFVRRFLLPDAGGSDP